MLRRVPELMPGVGERVRQIFEPDCPAGIRDAAGAIKNFLESMNHVLRYSPNNIDYNVFDINDGFDASGRIVVLEGYEHIGTVVGYRPHVGGWGHVVAYVKINDDWFLADNNAGYLIPRPIGPVCPNNQRLDATSGALPADVPVFVRHIHVSKKIPFRFSDVGGGSPIAAQEGSTCATDTIHNIMFMGNRVRDIFLFLILSGKDATGPADIWRRLDTYFGNKPEFRTLLEALTLMISRQIEVSAHPSVVLLPDVVDRTCAALPRAGRRHRTRRRKLKVLTNRRKHFK